MYALFHQRFGPWLDCLATATPALSNESAHREPLQTFWPAQASPSRPRAERRQSKRAIFTPLSFRWSRNGKSDQADQKITYAASLEFEHFRKPRLIRPSRYDFSSS